LLDGAGVIGLALVGEHRDAHLGLGHVALLVGARLGFAQFAFFLRGNLLALEGFDLLHRDLARAQLVEDDFHILILTRRGRRANQHFL